MTPPATDESANTARRIDCHVHLIGDGSAGDGCWLKLDSLKSRIQARFLLRAAGLPGDALKTGLDAAYRDKLLEMLRNSSLDALVVLAQDLPHTDSGEPLPQQAVFYVPNEVVLKLAQDHPGEIIAATSIHPARADALDALDACAEGGARVLKLLPNCLNVDCNRPKYRPFWERMAQHKMVFLAHTGGELTLPVMEPSYASPEILRGPLEAGVHCIAAHGAGRSGFRDPDYTDLLLAMMDEYPNLRTDNSALCSVNRSHTLRKLLDSGKLDRVLHGSDFPIPVSVLAPRLRRLITAPEARIAEGLNNPIECDAYLKQAIGFPETTFTALDGILSGKV